MSIDDATEPVDDDQARQAEAERVDAGLHDYDSNAVPANDEASDDGTTEPTG